MGEGVFDEVMVEFAGDALAAEVLVDGQHVGVGIGAGLGEKAEEIACNPVVYFGDIGGVPELSNEQDVVT